jgi:dipeptidyl aminopeptidase/acylaminoacyl peptidase
MAVKLEPIHRLEQLFGGEFQMQGRGQKAVSALWAAVACLGFAMSPALRAADLPADALSQDIVGLLDGDDAPRIAVDPRRRYLLLVRERKLLPIERLAEPAVELAGRRINPYTGAPHAPLDYHALRLVDLLRGDDVEIPVPRNATISFPQWAPDGSRFALTLQQRGGPPELWIGEPGEARLRPLLRSVNAARGRSCEWLADSRSLLCKYTPAGRQADPAQVELLTATDDPYGLKRVRAAAANAAVSRSLLESQLELIDSISGQRHAIGQPAAIENVEAAPAGAFLLVTRMDGSLPIIDGIEPVRTVQEIWDRFGRRVTTLPAGARAAGWHASKPATLVWVEQREGRDVVLSSDPPFDAAPKEAFVLPHRFGGMRWIGDDGLALISDYAPDQRQSRSWLVDLAGTAEPQLIAAPGAAEHALPVMGTNRHGVEVIVEDQGRIYFRSVATDDAGAQAVVEQLALATGQRQRLWTGSSPGYEEVVDVLAPDAARLLLRRESRESPPNYFLRYAGGAETRLTDVDRPSLALAGMQRSRLEYSRADGLELSATLYLPPDYDGRDRLPLIVWAYPHRIPAGASGKLADESGRFPSVDRAFRLFFLLRGYAVLDDVSMPIVGAAADANDTFIEQVVANAEAAVDAAANTGVIDVSRVGVAGHSYGAFMVANLLAHSRLFSAGIALSGAYNRTLTPFGFQTETRTLWDATETYLAMSPLIYANRIEAPLLLVHGLLDDNRGTAPLQSMQFYEAIRGTGGTADLLLLPWEGHEYRARDSVLATAARMLDWFDRYLEQGSLINDREETGAFLRPSNPKP